MGNADLIRLIDSISRDKNIEKDLVYEDIESAMASAARKAFGETEDVEVRIDRMTGEISAVANGEQIEMKQLGRIAAQTAKQVIIQRIREAERGSIFDEFSQRVGTIVTGTVSRVEGNLLIVNIGRGEGFLPRSEQIPGESHHVGERIRAMILDVREAPYQVRIVLTRSHPDYIRRLFELEVPEVAEKVIEMRALAREAGYRTKVAVASIDMKVDAVGACVGVRGSRIRNIVDELGGEKIDIVRWNESSQILIGNALKPAEIQEVALCFELGRATVVVSEDQLSLAIGKRGQNVRLAARLTGWDIDILTPAEYNKGLDDLHTALRSIDGVDDVLLDKILALGIINLLDIKEVGTEPLVKELELEEELANRIVETAEEVCTRLIEEEEKAKAERAAAEAAGIVADDADGDGSSEAEAETAGDTATETTSEGETEAVAQEEAVTEVPVPAETEAASEGELEAVPEGEAVEQQDGAAADVPVSCEAEAVADGEPEVVSDGETVADVAASDGNETGVVEGPVHEVTPTTVEDGGGDVQQG